MNRLIFDDAQLDGDHGLVHLDAAQVQHVHTVLHSRIGDALRIGHLNGPIGEGRIVTLEADKVVLSCTWHKVPTAPNIDLLLALPRPKVMRRLWSVLSAMGVGHIVLCNAARVERNYFDTHWLHPARYTPLLREGLQQSGDTHMPDVTIVKRFRPWVEDALPTCFPDAYRVMGDPAGEEVRPCPDAESRILLAIGPEGGWDTFERELLAQHGFTSVSLGPRILRSDTACVALITLANTWGAPQCV